MKRNKKFKTLFDLQTGEDKGTAQQLSHDRVGEENLLSNSVGIDNSTPVSGGVDLDEIQAHKFSTAEAEQFLDLQEELRRNPEPVQHVTATIIPPHSGEEGDSKPSLAELANDNDDLQLDGVGQAQPEAKGDSLNNNNQQNKREGTDNSTSNSVGSTTNDVDEDWEYVKGQAFLLPYSAKSLFVGFMTALNPANSKNARLHEGGRLVAVITILQFMPEFQFIMLSQYPEELKMAMVVGLYLLIAVALSWVWDIIDLFSISIERKNKIHGEILDDLHSENQRQLDQNIENIDELTKSTADVRKKINKINTDYKNDAMDFLFTDDDQKKIDHK